jgi:hypothetical protein
MQGAFQRAIANVVKHGDKALKVLKEYLSKFPEYLRTYPPSHEIVLAPVGYQGFRWATQLDPVWNAYFLGLVIEIAPAIEAARISAD